MNTLFQILGLLGAAFLIFGYFCVSSEKIKPTSIRFQLINLIGALLLIINSAYFFAIGPTVLNFFWAGIAVYQLSKLLKRRARS